MKYIPKILTNEIKERVRLIGELNHSTRRMKSQRFKEKAIKKNAQIHSYRIEHPNLRVPFCIPRNSEKKNIKKGIKSIANAFEWGCRNFDSENFKESFIREIAGRITPELYNGKIAEYREKGTSIRGATVTPPYPYKIREIEIPNFVESLKKQLKCEDVINKIETAIYAHLHLVRIHPFVDGNGRTSRTLQDIVLDHYNIPLPIIEAGERATYYKILDKAISDWGDRKGSKRIMHGATEGEYYNDPELYLAKF